MPVYRESNLEISCPQSVVSSHFSAEFRESERERARERFEKIIATQEYSRLPGQTLEVPNPGVENSPVRLTSAQLEIIARNKAAALVRRRERERREAEVHGRAVLFFNFPATNFIVSQLPSSQDPCDSLSSQFLMDCDSLSSQGSTQTEQGALTQEQRDRIATNRAAALARRRERELHSRTEVIGILGPPMQRTPSLQGAWSLYQNQRIWRCTGSTYTVAKRARRPSWQESLAPIRES